MKTKARILVFIDWFDPAFKAGGPIISVRNLVSGLKEEFDFYIVTGSSDYRSNEPLTNVKFNEWTIHGVGCKVYYSDAPSFSLFRKLFKDIQANWVYVNGMYSFNFSILPLLLKYVGANLIVAPRGMLSTGSKNVKSVKKNTFLSIAKLLKLYKDVKFHATSEHELVDIKREIGESTTTQLASNLPSSILKEIEPTRKEKGNLKCICIARVAPEKNVLFGIKLLSTLDEQVSLDIYGPIYDGEYYNLCKAIIHENNLEIRVRFRKEFNPNELPEILSRYHVFLSPTSGENFGHAIFEALSFGLPCIISDQTPWKLNSENRTGFALELSSTDKWTNGLETFVNMDNEEYQIWSESSYKFARNFLDESNSLNQYVELFQN